MGVVYVADSAAVAMISDAVFSDAGRPLQMFVSSSLSASCASRLACFYCVCVLLFFFLLLLAGCRITLVTGISVSRAPSAL